MRRILGGLSLFLALLGTGAILGQIGLEQSIEDRLMAAGVSWETKDVAVGRMSWDSLTSEALSANRLTIELGWPIKVEIWAPTIDASKIERWIRPSTVSASSEWRPQWEAKAFDLSVQWEDEDLVTGLDGALYPRIIMTNGETSISASLHPRMGVSLAGTVTGQLPHPNLSGAGQLDFQLGSTVTFRLTAASAQTHHPFIAEDALPPTALHAEGSWDKRNGSLSARGSFGDVGWSAEGQAATDRVVLDVAIPLTPLAKVVDLFGPGVPEAQVSAINGDVSLQAHITGPEWAWALEPGARDLAVSGAVPADFGQPIVRWRSRDRRHCGDDVECVPREVQHITGPRTAGWVSLAAAGWMPEAVIAAEDIRFRSHPGYDLIAIQEALADAGSDERLRGGSTLTQQLAKNLFLDGRRTLRRKLRELLLAMSLEERMTKDAILTLYLNVVEFGPGIWGIRDAAEAWFMKTPDQLTAKEAAFLAAILPAPEMWHRRLSSGGPVPHARVNAVLDRMRRRGSLSRTDHAEARAEDLRVVPPVDSL